ncbi:serine/threonine protein kinase [Streptomyces sp. NBC_01020]|uniref:WD40 repeat domain-containing serine/threonine protein kinase n=1 Tax=Streptomyces sp. NBC_01020 TaxID=2903722 RepID=UPI003867675B|nr:serine/threonine protein kinase [Streptomyces sp. NBC_01020]
MAGFMELKPSDPAHIGPYTVVARLGAGGMGRVYLGRSRGGRTVAVKVVRAELTEDPGFRLRFAREVDAARRVNGLFTAGVVAADPEGDPAWLATAYVPGVALSAAVAEHGPLPEGAVTALGAGLAEALEAIHAAGVVHRDLKPSNVLLAADGPRVIDFGISLAAEATALTGTGMVVGTPGFMSPEQLTGAAIGPASDVFSLGAVLAFAAGGRGPFGTGAAHPLMFRIVHEAPDLSGVPPRLRDVVAECLAKEPAGRPSVPEVLERFAALNPARPPGPGRAFEADWMPGPVARTVRDRAPGEPEVPDGTAPVGTASAVTNPAVSEAPDGTAPAPAPADPLPRNPPTHPATSLSDRPTETAPRLQCPRPAPGLPPGPPAAPGAGGDADHPAAEPAPGPSADAGRTTANRPAALVDDSRTVSSPGAPLPRRRLLLGVLGAAALTGGVATAVALKGHGSSGSPGAAHGASPTATNARRALAVLRCDSPVHSLAYAPRGGTLATGDEYGTVQLWDVAARKRTGSITNVVDGFGGGPIGGLAFSPDGTLLATSGGNGARLWHVATRKTAAVLSSLGDGRSIGPLAFSPDGKSLVAGEDRGVIQWWRVPGGKPAATLADPGRTDEAMVAFSPDGRTLVTADINRARWWDVATKKTTAVITDRSNPVLYGRAFSPDRRLFASGDVFGVIKLWDMVTKKQTATLESDTKIVMALAFSPDGKTLASGSSDSTTLLWDVATRKISARLTGHTGGVYCAEFNPDGKTLATGSADHTVRLWNTAGRGQAVS